MAVGRRFDWERFLRTRHIEWEQSGRRELAVRCPFCGPDDPSHHMSINLDGRGWRCWRAPDRHYGRSPVALVQQLLGCSREEAEEIVGVAGPPPALPADLRAQNLRRLRGEHVGAAPSARRLELPSQFRPLTTDDPRAEPFRQYLIEERGYRPREVDWLAEAYDLRWAVVGKYAWRVIFPVRDRWGRLLTWTGRTISPRVEPRYRQPPVAESVVEAPKTLLGLDRLWKVPDARALVVCEGPLDAARVSASGASLGVWGTCLFGLSASPEQRDLLLELRSHFAWTALLVDAAARHVRLRLARQLAPLTLVFPRLPEGVGDPGDLSAAQAAELCMSILDEGRALSPHPSQLG